MLVLRLALRSMRWRAGSAVTIFAVALVAALAATVGPVYLHAVDERVLAAHLSDASEYQREVSITRSSLIGYDVNWNAQIRSLAGQLGRTGFFGPPTEAEQVNVDYDDVPTPAMGPLVALDHQCAHLHILSGSCVSTSSSVNDAVIASTTAKLDHIRVGQTLVADTTATPLHLHVIGIYQPVAPTGPYWLPWGLFRFGTPPPTPNDPPWADATFLTRDALASRVSVFQQQFSSMLQVRPHRVHYDDVPAVRAAVGSVTSRVNALKRKSDTTGVPVSMVTTSLPTVFDSVAHETSLARTLVTVATAQLALLAIFVLYALVSNTTTAQGPEVALAKLRGRRTRSVVLQSVAQPVLLVIAAAPVGAALAWVLVRLVAPRALGGHVGITFPPVAYGIAALAAAGGVLAAAIATRRIVVTPVGALLRRGGDAVRSRTGLLVADVAIVALAIAGLIELEVGGVLDGSTPNPLAALAPTLVAIGLAIVVLRLLPLVGRGVARWTRDSARVASFLAVRQLLRRPSEARALLPVAVALAIAAFAVTNWANAGHNRELRALNSAGASRVLEVRSGPEVNDLRAAVDAADPSGNSMAVAYTNLDQLPPLIAVDTSRFARVAAWVPGNAKPPLNSVLHRIAYDRPGPVALLGSRLRFTIDLGQHPKQPVTLTVKLAATGRAFATREITDVAAGRSTRTVGLPETCLQGCRISSVQLSANTPFTAPSPTSTSTIAATISASYYAPGHWQPLPSFAESDRWRNDGEGPARIGSSVQTGSDAKALVLTLKQLDGSSPWPTIESASTPTALAAVVSSDTAARYPGDEIHQVVAVGLDGQSVSIDGVVRSVTLPRIDRTGVMVDYRAALAATAGAPATSSHFQVWLGPSAPADMTARLARQHVRVTGVIRASTFRTRLDDTGPSFADTLFLIAALAATVLAIGATAVARVVSVRRRSYELAALEAVGVAPRTLRRATTAEQVTVFAVGLIVGLVAGLVGSRLALPSTPVFVNSGEGPPLVYGLPWTLLGILTAALIVLFVVVSLAIAALVERTATPSQLRAAQQ